ncbi:hypothetical protein HDU83_009815 [Entophlyctis luteolus]|nr:hypothetical protein HDU82_004947 [Entophlyctis luteolus]KAJ3350245.1 hypothetical protein HDU83_009815 [Entophlyctis luteolus]
MKPKNLTSVFSCPHEGCFTLFWAKPETVVNSWYDDRLYDGIIAQLLYSTDWEQRESIKYADLNSSNSGPVIEVESEDFFYAYVLANPGEVQHGLFFSANDNETFNVEYTLWYNSSRNYQDEGELFSENDLRLVRAVDEAIVSFLKGQSLSEKKPEFNLSVQDWSINDTSNQPSEVFRKLASPFILSTMVITVIGSRAPDAIA